MSLESLLKTFKWWDEQVQKQYTKVGKEWEDTGHSRYSIAIPLNVAWYYLSWESGIPRLPSGFLFGWNMMNDTTQRPYGTKDKAVQDTLEESLADHIFNNILKFIDKSIRLPLLITGVGFAGKGIYHIINSMVTGDTNGLSELGNDFKAATAFISVASSLYIKDIDPRLLDKQPVLNQEYRWDKEKIIPLVPQPSPQSSTTQIYPTLGNYVQSPVQTK